MIPWGSRENAGLGMKLLKGLEMRSTGIIKDGLHIQLFPSFAFMADINVQSQGFFFPSVPDGSRLGKNPFS